MNKLEEEYNEWKLTEHGEEVYETAYTMALQMVEKGFKHYSIRTIITVIRFHRELKSGADEDGYKVNDHHAAYLVRELIATGKFPVGFFKIRAVKTERQPKLGQADMFA